MRAVGIRELKNKLSQYVRLVEAGESVLVTDRGTVVAELRPPGTTTLPIESDELSPGMVELARRGAAKLGAAHDPGLYGPRRPVLGDGSAERLVDWVRGDG